MIAAAIIESCHTRLLLPNERAIEPQITAIYRRFGLNDRQIEILARAMPKRDYYCQSRRGNRLFDLGLTRDPACLGIWAENRDRFLKQGAQTPDAPDAPTTLWPSAPAEDPIVKEMQPVTPPEPARPPVSPDEGAR